MKRNGILYKVAAFLREHAGSLAVFAFASIAHALGLLGQVESMALFALGLGYSDALTVQRAAGTLFATYTTAKSVINATELVQLPPNWWYVGKRIRVTVRGGISNIVTTPGTIAFQVMMGSIVVWTSGNIQLNATAHTTLPFELVIDLRCDSIGSGTAAKLMGMGTLKGIMFTLTAGQVDAVNTSGAFMVPVTAPAVGTGFDSTIANILDHWVGFSISNGGNGVQVQDYLVEELN